jgi:hypothetical protein
MHSRCVFRLIGFLLCFLGLSMFLPLFVSLLYNDPNTRPLIFSITIYCSAGLIVFFSPGGRKSYI